MKRRIVFVLALAVLLLACIIPSTVTQTAAPAPVATNTAAGGGTLPTNTVAAAPLPTDTVAAAPLPTDTAAVPTNASCGPLSVYLPPALASSYSCQTIPESADLSLPPFGINPQYSEIDLSGYPLTDRFMSPHINIYPVQRYRELLPDLVNPRLTALQTLIGGGAPGTATLPILPIQNAAQFFYAQYAVVAFQNGSGIRYITEYGQAYYPINNHDMWLSYQGLTTDGAYWISMILPISHPSLPANGDTPPGGDWNAFYDNAQSYFAQVTTDLNAQAPASFAPSIETIDALIQSMIVTP
jgi:hypothetical protein